MKNFKIFATILMVMIYVSCSKDQYKSAIDDDTAPGPVTNIKVEALPGGAKISYTLPDDGSLRYVRAEYNIRAGYPRESKSSLYTDYVIVDGFPTTDEYEVKLFSVSSGENSSEPVVVKVVPLPAPLEEAYSTLDFTETFGGVTVSFQNSGEASLAVTLLADSAGRMVEIETYYTKTKEGRHSIRGFAAVPRIFGAVVRDRWGNISDTVRAERTPVFEQLIPKSAFKTYNLPSDTYTPHAGANNTIDKLWDDRVAPNGGVPIFHTVPGSGMPQWFTFDMGNVAKLSRFKMVHRGPGTQWAYQNGAPKKFEVWGSATPPDPQGSWEGWTKLMDANSFKPSGDGAITTDDITFATTTGEDFIFPEEAPEVRYLRFRMLETWGFVDYIYIGELTFWGKLQ